MEHKQIPEAGSDGLLPEFSQDFPEQMEPLELYSDVIAETEDLPDAPVAEEQTDLPSETIFSEAIPEMTEEVSISDALFERIPDVEADDPADSGIEAEIADALTLEIMRDPEFAPTPQPEAPEEIPYQEYRDNGKVTEDDDNAETEKNDSSLFQFPVRKGRPRRKKGEGFLGIPNILVTFVWLALIVSIGVTLGRMIWVCAADVLAFGREDKPVTITIYEADTMEDIIEKLHSNGLIRYKSLFTLYADISNAEEDIRPGIYDLNTRYDYHALVNFMSPRSSREVVEDVLIPEGYTCQQIFALLEEHKICTAVDLAAYAANGELDEYWFLEDVQRGSENCLEGYLFPDTYDFYKNSSPREVLTKLLNNFENRFSEELRQQIEKLNAEVTHDSYGIREIVIVASLIERESSSAEESPAIAGVIYNRLFNWGYPAYLNIDASIIYAQGGDSEHIDTKLDSPYNTYTNIGLTPGPIANPGLSSLKAALKPESHNYYYYVLNPSTGKHQFSTTEREHNAWVAEFYG